MKSIPESMRTLSDELLTVIISSGSDSDQKKAHEELERRRSQSSAITKIKFRTCDQFVELITLVDSDDAVEAQKILVRELRSLGGTLGMISLKASDPRIKDIGIYINLSALKSAKHDSVTIDDDGVKEVKLGK